MMFQQNQHDVLQMVQALDAAKGSKSSTKKLGYSCKKNTYAVEGSDIFVDSWKFNDWDYKKSNLPTYARGLFTTKNSQGRPEIVTRGYDKFFNVDEVRETEWGNIEKDTVGPYELSVKENGCIIFVSGLEDGTLLVCSKHSTGARSDVTASHSIVGKKWIERHVASVGKTTAELAQTLRQMNATCVGELCDDEFEEHVLAYPPELAGFYMHGINFNLPEFATCSGADVHAFADAWGFKKADYQIIQSLDEVKQFLEKCAETGSWAGRDTEGFVVRCKIKGSSGNPSRDWFFKYKFEEPYLMYRQWREATKAIIAGKAPRYKKHKKITEEYLYYARRCLAADKKLGVEYNKNHGIIAMRDGFLAEKGRTGADLIAEEEKETGNDGNFNVLICPIATIGCGKTTIASALVKLFGWGHVQNDNIQGKGNRPARFTMQITNEMALKQVVIADRNNHQKRERQQIIEDVSRVVPDVKFVAMHYVHEPKDRLLNDIRKVTQTRVLDRGDNHQTIHAGSKGQQEILGIMEGFLKRFEGCDTNRDPDAAFDEIINLDPTASSIENLEIVVSHLFNAYPTLFQGKEMPSYHEMQEAIDAALSLSVDAASMHDLSGSLQKKKHSSQANSRRATPEPRTLTSHELVKRLEYFSLVVSTTNISSILSSLFADANVDDARFYKQLKGTKRIQNEFHVTLVHRANSSTNPELWQAYLEQFTNNLSTQSDMSNRTPSLGSARIRLERLIWDERLMGILVRILPTADGVVWPCSNEYPHITIGTAGDGIKPKEMNDLITRWAKSDGNDASIKSKEIPGLKELDGSVRPVMQRGR